MIYLASVLCVAMAVLVVSRPIAALLLYGATATYADGFGLSQWLSEIPWFDTVMNALFIGLFARASFRLLGSRGLENHAVRAAWVSLLTTLWCLLSVYLGGTTPLSSLSELPYLALPYVVVWIAFASEKSSLQYLTVFVTAQVALAFAILLIPGLGFLQGNRYMEWFTPSTSPSGAILALPNAATLKGISGNHYAQFHNPNLLGFYAVTAIALGLYFAFRYATKSRIFGVTLLLVGLFLWINSLPRGPMIGLLAMVALGWFFTRDAHKTPTRAALTLVFGLTGGAALLISAYLGGMLDFLLPSGSDISVTSRFDGYAEALRVISQNPWLGADSEFAWNPRARPHFLGLLFAAEYGVIAGLSITWIVFVGGGLAAWRSIRDQRRPMSEALLVGMLYGSMAGIAATNNFAGPMLFAVLLAHLLVVGAKYQSGHMTAATAVGVVRDPRKSTPRYDPVVTGSPLTDQSKHRP